MREPDLGGLALRPVGGCCIGTAVLSSSDILLQYVSMLLPKPELEKYIFLLAGVRSRFVVLPRSASGRIINTK